MNTNLQNNFDLTHADNIQVVVLMGGLGKRLKGFTKECPKPLVEIKGIPFFQYQLELMVQQGFKKFVFCVGYKGEMIQEYFGNGEKWEIDIRYSFDGEKLLGTGGAICGALRMLESDFMVIYADSFMDVNYDEILYRYYEGKQKGNQALMTVMHNSNKYDASNVDYSDGEIILYDKNNPSEKMSYIDYGISLFERNLFDYIPKDEVFDLSMLQNTLSIENRLSACEVIKRFYEIGSPDSLSEFCAYVEKRFFKSCPAVFLDRDGVINEIVYNEETEQLDSPLKPEEFKLLPNVAEALKKIKEKGYYIFVVTNQPAAAKGKTRLAMLYDINMAFIKKMKNAFGVEIDEVFMCPHYISKSVYTKDEFLIQNCECRKPKAGMLSKAMNKYNVNSEDCYMVGDSYTDILAGRKAGAKTVFIGELKCDFCKMIDYDKPDLICKSLYDFSITLKEVK